MLFDDDFRNQFRVTHCQGQEDEDKKNILDYKFEGKDIILLFNNSIGRYSLANGDACLERNFINKDYGGLNQIIIQ